MGGGKLPIKVAPYTRGMLDIYRNSLISSLILSTSTGRGKLDVTPTDKVHSMGLRPCPI
jgi:hypothetical protein